MDSLTINVNETTHVSALLQMPPNARALYVLAHGAGAGMKHPFMASIANELAEVGIGTLRYQFPYMEQGSKRPDAPALAHATVRAAVAEAARHAGSVKLIAGGKSFGGRMTSQAAADKKPSNAGRLGAEVRGLVFLGFPLHPAKKPSIAGRLKEPPSIERARHLHDVDIPMLFLQGTRDELADLTLLEPIVQQLGPLATLKKIEHADHSFHVPARSGRKDADVLKELAQTIAAWADNL